MTKKNLTVTDTVIIRRGSTYDKGDKSPQEICIEVIKMSEKYIKDLHRALSRRWEIIVYPAGEFGISAIWSLTSSGKKERNVNLLFEGLNDGDEYSDETYGCHVKEDPDINLYFYTTHNQWSEKRHDFVSRLNALATK